MEPQTKDYQNPSMFSKCLRPILRPILFLLSDKNKRKKHKEQFNQFSRNLELATENFLKMIFKHPIKAGTIIKGVSNFSSLYLGAQKNSENKEKYLVYTEFDKNIPFIPEEDTMYTHIYSQIAYVSKNICKLISRKKLKDITRCFMDLNELGAKTFNKHPTVMPRFKEHDRFALDVIQKYDAPTNCCPSLHISYSILLDNIGEKIIKPKSEEIFNSIRYSTKRMFNSVLYTKQHSLMDIAFGILCSKAVYDKYFPEDKFNDFTETFDLMKKENPKINYNEIKNIYQKALKIHKKTNNLSESVGTYLKENKFAKVNSEQEVNNSYFHTKKKKIIS